ncbi:hypothetical protein ALNOE001_04530 [Candidatus Methanobinarius endosymbioticus]|uniref:Uncharacterized protein n=1 Tax=Candidatus Methanobinarius endosymbioticus TaxID=2006182 RepID=A0A366MCX1_9EURY|nr:hypothetical protein ALNOE001_04530 [Candidatus Methanobinarius endosymbioticus]
MRRNPFDQYFKDPDRRAELYLLSVAAMVITTFLLTIGTIIFILILLGIL